MPQVCYAWGMSYFKEESATVYFKLPVSKSNQDDKYNFWLYTTKLSHLPAVGDAVQIGLDTDFSLPVTHRVWNTRGIPEIHLEPVFFSPKSTFSSHKPSITDILYSREETLNLLQNQGWQPMRTSARYLR